jgi:prolyl-tRNA editing enzyme YbaK/EbsC (Cys-tRNA(Pro) deacylase)
MISILDKSVAKFITDFNLHVEELACDPDYADTAAFNEKYGFTAEQGANTILVTSRKVDPTKYAVCVVLASTRLDVNKMVTKLIGVKKASFADSETTKELTGMEIGGVTAIGISGYPIFIDAAVMDQPKIVMGGGNRTSKAVIDPHELLKLPSVEIVTDLAKPIVSMED